MTKSGCALGSLGIANQFGGWGESVQRKDSHLGPLVLTSRETTRLKKKEHEAWAQRVRCRSLQAPFHAHPAEAATALKWTGESHSTGGCDCRGGDERGAACLTKLVRKSRLTNKVGCPLKPPSSQLLHMGQSYPGMASGPEVLPSLAHPVTLANS